MVENVRHAAGQTTYEVREILEGDPALDLGVRFESTDFGAALDFAFDFLEKRDPRREGAVSGLEIVRAQGSARESVWSYSHARASVASRDLVRVWGFDVTRQWHNPYRATARPRPLHT
ncbi:MAG: hypothetical protein ACRDM9_00080 [Gaiellaceae bacterium]